MFTGFVNTPRNSAFFYVEFFGRLTMVKAGGINQHERFFKIRFKQFDLLKQ